MTFKQLKTLLIALFTLVFIIGFVINAYQIYVAIALCVILVMIVYVGHQADKADADGVNQLACEDDNKTKKANHQQSSTKEEIK